MENITTFPFHANTGALTQALEQQPANTAS